ncbi:ABC transporter ATP-binding protein [Klugiella xanthotipulae]|uniref:Iron complex transport system ATP-binding protein n=1 Tax=Klugiella xanthotipulae TaxID=244735 RepID=A0A543HSQ8_9MICO|nr:ABC transporter ATP-binding protein [Klugiella xanthotipulae]TQM61372.1 iron complex transport system ATP-binding protein [Klugiella xanthotipulae]
MSGVLEFSDVSYVRNGNRILNGVSWSVREDQRWVILGPNGAGKTTLMRLATGHEHPTSGTVTVLGSQLGTVNIFELRNRLGFASSAQAKRIPANETVINTVMTAAYSVEGRWNEKYEDLDVRRAERVLSEWGLHDLSQRTFGTLSDGEQKRTLIARAVMTDPEMLLLDEPASSLDLGARERLLQLLSGYASSPTSPAMVMVTHHVEEIPPGFTHALLLSGERVIAAGECESTLTAEALSSTFGLEFNLTKDHDRYTARAL